MSDILVSGLTRRSAMTRNLQILATVAFTLFFAVGGAAATDTPTTTEVPTYSTASDTSAWAPSSVGTTTGAAGVLSWSDPADITSKSGLFGFGDHFNGQGHDQNDGDNDSDDRDHDHDHDHDHHCYSRDFDWWHPSWFKPCPPASR
jgi:hypothetical protein